MLLKDYTIFYIQSSFAVDYNNRRITIQKVTEC